MERDYKGKKMGGEGGGGDQDSVKTNLNQDERSLTVLKP